MFFPFILPFPFFLWCFRYSVPISCFSLQLSISLLLAFPPFSFTNFLPRYSPFLYLYLRLFFFQRYSSFFCSRSPFRPPGYLKEETQTLYFSFFFLTRKNAIVFLRVKGSWGLAAGGGRLVVYFLSLFMLIFLPSSSSSFSFFSSSSSSPLRHSAKYMEIKPLHSSTLLEKLQRG